MDKIENENIVKIEVIEKDKSEKEEINDKSEEINDIKDEKNDKKEIKQTIKYHKKHITQEEYDERKKVLLNQLFDAHKKEFDKQNFNFCWKQTLDVYVVQYVRTTVHTPNVKKNQKQLVNHFPNINCLVTKTGLLGSLTTFYESRGERVFINIPTTYYIKKPKYVNQNNNDRITEWNLFVNRYKELENKNYSRELVPSKFCEKNIWIVKPTGLNCGRGIMVFDKIDSIKKFINSGGSGSEYFLYYK